ncbi:hypothetical protein EGW08_003234, partial [Elysia chlorotica]
ALPDALEHVLGAAALADGAGRQVDQLVAVLVDAREQLGHARLGPVAPDDRQYLAQHVRPGGNRMRCLNDNLVVVVPQVNVGHAARGALVLRCHGEHHLVVARAQTHLA